MNRFTPSRKTLRSRIRSLAAGGMLGLGILGVGATPALALPYYPMTAPATLDCDSGAGGYVLHLPFGDTPAYVTLYARVDGGAWQKTNPWYTSGFANWEWKNGRWYAVISEPAMIRVSLAGGHLVEAWELRQANYGVGGEWINLGSCNTGVDYLNLEDGRITFN